DASAPPARHARKRIPGAHTSCLSTRPPPGHPRTAVPPRAGARAVRGFGPKPGCHPPGRRLYNQGIRPRAAVARRTDEIRMAFFQTDTLWVNQLADGVAALILDVPDRPVNVLSRRVLADLDEALDRVAAEDSF